MTSKMTTREDRIRGVAIGQAVGDASGSWCEFGPKGSQPDLGRPGVFGHPPGSWTDDSEQLTCVLTARSDPVKLAAGLLSWYDGGPRDVGSWTSGVLRRARSARGLLAASKAAGEREAGMIRPATWDYGLANGSLMRSSAVCLPFLGDRAKVAQAARACSDVTHFDPSGYTGDACVLWSLAIDAAICSEVVGSQTFESLGAAGLVSSGLDLIPEARRQYWEAQILEACRSHPSRFNPNGGCVAAFKAALSSVSCSYTYEGTIRAAIAIGADTDTVAAIAGGLAGAIYGMSQIPEAWVSQVHGWSPAGQITAAQLGELALQAAGLQV